MILGPGLAIPRRSIDDHPGTKQGGMASEFARTHWRSSALTPGPVMEADMAIDCGALLIACCRDCWTGPIPWWHPENRGSWYHHCCDIICQGEYMACVALNGIGSACVAVLDFGGECATWLANHPAAVVGTIIVVAGVILVVTTGPGGALVLAAV